MLHSAPLTSFLSFSFLLLVGSVWEYQGRRWDLDSELSLSISMWFCRTILGRTRLAGPSLPPRSSASRGMINQILHGPLDPRPSWERFESLKTGFWYVIILQIIIPYSAGYQLISLDGPGSPPSSRHGDLQDNLGCNTNFVISRTCLSLWLETLTRDLTCRPGSQLTGIAATLPLTTSSLLCAEGIL